MRKIEKYTNLNFSDSQHPKPKNWSRKTFKCNCNIPIYQKSTDKILSRIDIDYIVSPKKQENVMIGGYNTKSWWFHGKPNNWKITHIKPTKFDDIEHTLHIGYIERGGGLTPAPLYIIIEDVEKYNKLILKEARLKKLKQLNV